MANTYNPDPDQEQRFREMFKDVQTESLEQKMQKLYAQIGKLRLEQPAEPEDDVIYEKPEAA